MGLLDRIEAERRGSLENPNTPFSDSSVWDAWDYGGPTAAGARINASSAHQIAAFYAGVRFISETVASLPLRLYRRTDGGRAVIDIDPRVSVWRDMPNPEMSAYSLREILQGHLVVWGNAYVEVLRDKRGVIRELWPLMPDKTQREWDEKRGTTYVTQIGDGERVRLPASRVMHIPGFGYDGRVGYSLLTLARETLGLASAAGQQAGSFFANGLRPSGVLTSPAPLNPKTRKNLRDSVKEQTGLSNTQRLLLLEGGITFEQMGIPPGDAQFLEQREFEVVEIARFLNLPPHVLRDLSRATFSNIEQQSLELVTYSLTPWFRRWEDGLKKDMLTEQERRTLFWKIDARGLLRGDSAARMAYLQGRFNTGSITPNEIRMIEDENPLPGGDQLYVHSAVVPLEQAGQEESEPIAVDDDRHFLLEGVTPAPAFGGVGGALVLDMWERLTRGEVRELKRIIKRGGSVEDYYATDFPEYAAKILAPLGGDTDALVNRYAYDARQQLRDLTPEQVALVLETWTDRAGIWADGA